MPKARRIGRKTSMNVSLTPELYNFVRSLLETGMYETQSEVVRAGLRLLIEEKSHFMGPKQLPLQQTKK